MEAEEQPLAERFETFLSAPCSIYGDGGTWREWIAATFTLLVEEGEGFSGKRPGCDSDWGWRLAEAMTDHVDPAIDGYGDTNWRLLTSRFGELMAYALAPRS